MNLLLKNRYMILFMVVILSIVCLGSFNEKRMEDNITSQQYLKMNIN